MADILWRTINGARVPINAKTGAPVGGAGGNILPEGWSRKGRAYLSGNGTLISVLKRGGRWFVEWGFEARGATTDARGAAMLSNQATGERSFATQEEADARARKYMAENPYKTPKAAPLKTVQSVPSRQPTKRDPMARLKPRQRQALNDAAARSGYPAADLYDAATTMQSDRGLSWPKALKAAEGYLAYRASRS